MSQPPVRFIGAHTPDAGGIAMAARRAGSAGMRALQVFSAPPTYYNEKVRVKADRVAGFRDAVGAAGIALRHVLVHAGYVLNPASPDDVKASRARTALERELERSTALGVGGFCFHPGSAGDGDALEACDRVGDAIRHALESVPETPEGTRVLIENTAGAGHTVGRTAAEIERMLARVPPGLRHRAGYGLDSCHLFASGHDLRSSAESQRAVLDAFDQTTGERPAFFHLNDSQYPMGSNRDRHALIGEGEIGVAPFGWLLRDPRTEGIPLVLETPSERAAVAADDPSPDPADVRMMALLRSLLPV